MGCDTYEIRNIELTDEECRVSVDYWAVSEHDEDKMFGGNKIIGEATAIIDNNKEVEYMNINAKIDFD